MNVIYVILLPLEERGSLIEREVSEKKPNPELMVWLKQTVSIRSSVYSASLNAFR